MGLPFDPGVRVNTKPFLLDVFKIGTFGAGEEIQSAI